ncbi:MAG: molybdenum cofactor biosynthesis protein MoaE [Leucobacter sp.]|nr:molybdenum cofactor biosynthesis protein MoaE [Leucobacter sp.]
MSEVFARITETAIDEAAVQAAVESPECGARVMFHGVIRDHDGGDDVRSLDYSAHPQAEEFLARIVAEEAERTGLALAAWHRIGHLQIGDAALVAASAAPHRREAFEAIEALVERIKHEVPIWKRQHYTSGSSDWVGL